MNVWAEAGSVTLTGLAIVFGVLAVIYLALKLMELALGRRIVIEVSSPRDGMVESVFAVGRVEEDGAVLTLRSGGALGEIPSPAAGRITVKVAEGAEVRAGDLLFTVEEAS